MFVIFTKATFRRNGSVTLRNEMKPFYCYWLIEPVTSILTNGTASFHFVTERNRTVSPERGPNVITFVSFIVVLRWLMLKMAHFLSRYPLSSYFHF